MKNAKNKNSWGRIIAGHQATVDVPDQRAGYITMCLSLLVSLDPTTQRGQRASVIDYVTYPYSVAVSDWFVNVDENMCPDAEEREWKLVYFMRVRPLWNFVIMFFFFFIYSEMYCLYELSTTVDNTWYNWSKMLFLW